MRYVVDLTQKQADQIARLVNLGKYLNTAQFILTAIENQLYIIEESDAAPNHVRSKLLESSAQIVSREKEHDDEGHPVIDSEIEGLNKIDFNPKILPMPKFNELACSIKRDKPIDEERVWLWGQVNRIFPIKLGLRVLLIMLKDDSVVDFEAFKTKAGNVALAFGKMIRSRERYNNKHRDERVSAGLPIDINDSKFKETIVMELRKKKHLDELDAYLQNEEYKSTNRYRAHFLVFERKDGKLDGAMSFLRFINIKKSNDEKISIGLTQKGLEFAKMKNPIIDEKNFERSLDENEINFYLDHISRNVKGEIVATMWLLKKIQGGITERERINEAIAKEYNQYWGDSSDVINTQRAGLMARMFELGLIEKEKNGVNVIYKVTNTGKKLIK